MSRLFVATRKGLFRLDELDDGKGWVVAPPSFLGDPVTMVLPDARDGRCTPRSGTAISA
jgi:hypothetical protein